MSHPFSVLQHDILWTTRIHFEIFDCEAELSVEAEDAGPEPWQLAVFDVFFERQSELKSSVYEAILSYYRSIEDDYRSRLGEAVVPYVSSVDDLRRTLVPEAVHVWDVFPERGVVGVLFQSDWEYGHGVGVRLENGVVVEAGTQDVCI